VETNRATILSTGPVKENLLLQAKEKGIDIEVFSFIETIPVKSEDLKKEIKQILSKKATIVFTSQNAVKVVADESGNNIPDPIAIGWQIFCIGNTTRKEVEKYFGKPGIAGTADNAKGLAEIIASDENIKEVYFFCGDQRRDELPDFLRKKGIAVNEVVVYQTIAASHELKKSYSGILFFSPSAAESYFSNNEPDSQTILFAIGNTTADALKIYSTNRIIIADKPSKENLFFKVIEFFQKNPAVAGSSRIKDHE
jgi:uroporphyrinogen-III synthase